jgi:Raf kinase inhibitor-like YbhB/YbcL family protein
MSLRLGNFRVKSSSFASLGRIPQRNSGYGENLSPPLEWTGVPRNAREFGVVCFDPDAPLPRGFTHWVVYGIPKSVNELSEGQKSDAFTPGVNETKRRVYLGPLPPEGHGVHHYYFWVYALDAELKLKPGLNRQEFWDAIEGRVVEQARIIGTYEG